MAFCTKCGEKNEEGVKFCTNCGNPLSADPSVSAENIMNDNSLICTKCGGRNEEGIKFCIGCGNPLSNSSSGSIETPMNDNLLICTKCGEKNEEGINFCTSCGNPLSANPSEKPITEKPVNASPTINRQVIEKPSDKSGKVVKKKKKVFLWLLIPLLALGLTFTVYNIVSKKIAETINPSKSESVELDTMPIQQVTPVNPEPMTPLDASTYLLSLKLGVNIANSFDAFNGRNQDNSETGWGNPVVDQELLNGIAAAGFSIVRIPVTWTRFIGSAPDYKIIESRLSRIAEVVNMARNAGLKVIINIHHDGAVWDTTVGWLRVDIAAKDQVEKERITAKFQAVWRQIAEYFANYGDYLIFESFNELSDENWGNPLVQAQVNIVNEWNKVFVDTVRSTGGNNSKRFLILKGYAADGYLTAGKLVIPPDVGNSGSNKLIVAFRYYEPYAFTHDLTMTSWGTAADKARVDQLFDILKKEYIDKGIPVILSGFGVKLNFDILDVQRNYLGYIAGAAHKRGMPALYNDEGNSNFGIFDRNSGQVRIPMRSNVQAIMDAVK